MIKTLLALTLLLCPSAFAALPSTAQWDVRTTGNDANGGCFDPALSGTDFSQQDSAQVAFTDLVIGTTTTQLTSAANPFTSASVGNCINITAGTGFTAGRYNVRSVASGVATMDRAVGTASSTGGVGNLGGSMLTPGAALAVIVSQNTVWLMAGTYTITATITPTSGVSESLQGYSATHGDNLSGAIITTATNSIALITVTGSNANFWINNIALSNTAATRGVGVFNNTGVLNIEVTNCTLTGFSKGIDAFTHAGASVYVLNSAILNTQGIGIAQQSGVVVVMDSVITGSTLHGIGATNNAALTQTIVIRSLIYGNGGAGVISASGPPGFITVLDSTVANNTSDGVSLASAGFAALGLMVQNSIIYGNGGHGLTIGSTPAGGVANLYARNNSYGGNTSGNLNNVPAGIGDKLLTAIPFTNAAVGDYSPNSAAGGGALLKGAGFPGVFPNGTTTGFPDVGPVQSAGGGTTTIVNNYGQSN